MQAHTEGWEAVLESATSTSWETITNTCGVAKSEMESAAKVISSSQLVVFGWAMGVTHQANSVDNVFSIANTALITGNAGAGTMPKPWTFQRPRLRIDGCNYSP